MEQFLLGIISLLVAFTHILFVVLLRNKKLKLRGLFTWLSITIVSVFIVIIQLVYQVSKNMIPIFPIMGLMGLILLAITLGLLICKYKKIKKWY